MRSIVTGVENAEASVRILERSLAEAESSHRPLRVVTAWSSPTRIGDMSSLGYAGTYIDTGDLAQAAKSRVDELLEKALSARRSDRPVVASAEAYSGDPGRVLVEQACDAQLLVVGGRGHGAVVSALFGSATSYVVHHAPCPVMVIPGTTAPGPFLRVIVGVDGTECSRSALRWALDAAARHQCPLTAVHASHTLTTPGLDTLSSGNDEIHDWLRDEIAVAIPDTREVKVFSEVVSGPASNALLAKAGPDDLLVVGSRGRGGFVDLVLGSVATQCIAHARGAVVVVHEGGERL